MKTNTRKVLNKLQMLLSVLFISNPRALKFRYVGNEKHASCDGVDVIFTRHSDEVGLADYPNDIVQSNSGTREGI